jgi:hypothetical protein
LLPKSGGHIDICRPTCVSTSVSISSVGVFCQAAPATQAVNNERQIDATTIQYVY